MRKILSLVVFVFLGILETQAQCSMCKAVAESNASGGGSVAEGLNNGILYLMAFPYVLMALVAFIWYRNKKSQRSVS